MRAVSGLLAAAALLVLAPAGATAPARPAPAPIAPAPGFQSNLPIDITSDALEVFREQRLTIFKGNVEAIQGEVRIRTPQLNLYSGVKAAPTGQPAGAAPGGGFGEIERMEAAGPAYYITPTQQARGDKAVYEKAPDTITMLGNVIVTQDKNVLAGDKLVIEQKTGHSTMVNTSGQSKRIRGVFYPNNAQPGAPGPAAPPAAKKPAKRT